MLHFVFEIFCYVVGAAVASWLFNHSPIGRLADAAGEWLRLQVVKLLLPAPRRLHDTPEYKAGYAAGVAAASGLDRMASLSKRLAEIQARSNAPQ